MYMHTSNLDLRSSIILLVTDSRNFNGCFGKNSKKFSQDRIEPILGNRTWKKKRNSIMILFILLNNFLIFSHFFIKKHNFITQSFNHNSIINILKYQILQDMTKLGLREKLAEKIVCKLWRNIFSGSFMEFVSIPKQHTLITSKVKLPKNLKNCKS